MVKSFKSIAKSIVQSSRRSREKQSPDETTSTTHSRGHPRTTRKAISPYKVNKDRQRNLVVMNNMKFYDENLDEQIYDLNLIDEERSLISVTSIDEKLQEFLNDTDKNIQLKVDSNSDKKDQRNVAEACIEHCSHFVGEELPRNSSASAPKTDRSISLASAPKTDRSLSLALAPKTERPLSLADVNVDIEDHEDILERLTSVSDCKGPVCSNASFNEGNDSDPRYDAVFVPADPDVGCSLPEYREQQNQVTDESFSRLISSTLSISSEEVGICYQSDDDFEMGNDIFLPNFRSSGSITVQKSHKNHMAPPILTLDAPDLDKQPFTRRPCSLVEQNSEQLYQLLCRTVRVKENDIAMTKIIDVMKNRQPSERILVDSETSATVLHIALLSKNETAAIMLLEAFPELAIKIYDTERFNGQNAFHIAAANGLQGVIEHMVNILKKDINGICSDFYMQKHSKQFDFVPLETLINAVADGAYFMEEYPEGALVLSAAVSNGAKHVIPLLVNSGAELDIKGPGGNTLLHFIIFLSAQHPESTFPMEAFDEIWEVCDVWWEKRKGSREGHLAQSRLVGNEAMRNQTRVEAFRELLDIQNDSSQTALELAVYLHANITYHILNFEGIYKQPQTSFGTISLATYDVTRVTSFLPRMKRLNPSEKSAGSGRPTRRSNRYNPNSVLHTLAHQAKIFKEGDQGYCDLIDVEPISSLVDMKWSVYQWVYMLWGIAHLTQMIALTVTGIYLNGEQFKYQMTSQKGHDVSERAVYLHIVAFLIVVVLHIGFEITDMLSVYHKYVHHYLKLSGKAMTLFAGLHYTTSRKGLRRSPPFFLHVAAREYTLTGNAPYRMADMISSVAIITWFFLHIQRSEKQDYALCVALIFGWLFVLFFTRGVRYISRFTIMVQKMFFQDFLYFAVVYVAILCAFSFGMHILVQHNYSKNVHISSTIYTMVNVITDAGSKAWDDPDHNDVGAPGKVLLSIYALLTSILMLNLLIAMMNTSYESVKNSRTNLLRHQRLSILLLIERRLWWLEALCDRSQEQVMTFDDRSYIDVTKRQGLS